AARLAGSKRQEELITEAREAQDEIASAKRDLSERTERLEAAEASVLAAEERERTAEAALQAARASAEDGE
ncbi:unnamed protein product, partial [Symbiodinium sp. KB8]